MWSLLVAIKLTTLVVKGTSWKCKWQNWWYNWGLIILHGRGWRQPWRLWVRHARLVIQSAMTRRVIYFGTSIRPWKDWWYPWGLAAPLTRPVIDLESYSPPCQDMGYAWRLRTRHVKANDTRHFKNNQYKKHEKPLLTSNNWTQTHADVNLGAG